LRRVLIGAEEGQPLQVRKVNSMNGAPASPRSGPALAFPGAGAEPRRAMKELRAIVAALGQPTAYPAVLATLVRVEGSSYRRPGARLLCPAAGPRVGAISGGCLEEDVLARAARVQATGISEVAVYDTTSENDLVWGVGLGCHGVVTVLLERLASPPPWVQALAENATARRPTDLEVRHSVGDAATWGTRLAPAPAAAAAPGRFDQRVPPPTRLILFGAGDDAMPLSQLAAGLGWQSMVADPRPALATRERFPSADACFAGPAGRLVGIVTPGPDDLAVVMTHHYVHDVPLLRDLLPLPLAYLGLLGPRKRAERILADLERDGLTVTPALRRRLHAPVGLDLGAEAPEQVALAIVAEILAVLHQRDARPLRERDRPIHAPEPLSR
jgi:xanthine dehydrogenase accessory factor